MELCSYRNTTKLRYSFRNSCSTLVVAFSVLKVFSAFYLVVLQQQTLVPCVASRFSFIELTFGRMPMLTR